MPGTATMIHCWLAAAPPPAELAQPCTLVPLPELPSAKSRNVLLDLFCIVYELSVPLTSCTSHCWFLSSELPCQPYTLVPLLALPLLKSKYVLLATFSNLYAPGGGDTTGVMIQCWLGV